MINDVIFNIRDAWNTPTEHGGDVLDEPRTLEPIAAAAITAPAPPALPAGSLERLPAVGAHGDPYWRLVTAFLVGYPPHSSRAYFSDLKAWHAWCADMGVHPLTARRHHVDVWVRHLSEQPQPATGRVASSASIARRLSCLSQFYDYGIRDAELLEHSPANVRRPKVSDDSATVGLTPRSSTACSRRPRPTGPDLRHS